MRIPEVRDEIYALSVSLGSPRLAELADELKRRKVALRVNPKSNPITPKLVALIKAYKLKHPRQAQHQIAAHFSVSQGRVSEILSGKRK